DSYLARKYPAALSSSGLPVRRPRSSGDERYFTSSKYAFGSMATVAPNAMTPAARTCRPRKKRIFTFLFSLLLWQANGRRFADRRDRQLHLAAAIVAGVVG